MSEENVEIVRSVLAAVAAGDREQAFAFVDPGCVIDASRNVFNPAIYEGIEGVREMFAGMDEAWERMHVEPFELIDAGDRVVAVGRLVGKGKGSGVEVERFNGQVWTLRGGRIVRLEIGYTDREATLEAAGLSE